MRLFMLVAILIFAKPILTGFGWAEGTNILLDPNLMCKKTRRLRGKMAEICRHDSGLLKEIISGINLGFRECEFQFQSRRWNCTTLRRSMRKILMKDSRETSFVNAITSAGVTYAVTRACSMGQLVECSCDRSHSRRNGGQPQMVNAATAAAALERQQNYELSRTQPGSRANRTRERSRKRKLLRKIEFPAGEWEWGGCSDHVNFGFRNSRTVLDAKSRVRSDLRTLLKLHNNNAGRLAIRESMRLECKCHGLSGSCTVKTCWLKMAPFREVGRRLRERFDGAVKVVARNDGDGFMAEQERSRRPTKRDLVYADESADFCLGSPKSGSLGTQGRECEATSTDGDGCELLCCARGHQRHVEAHWVSCKCVFKWCCAVSCERCLERRAVSTCL